MTLAVFERAYVERLRAEAARYRTRARAAEARLRELTMTTHDPHEEGDK